MSKYDSITACIPEGDDCTDLGFVVIQKGDWPHKKKTVVYQ